MTTDELDRLEELAAAATPGPWRTFDDSAVIAAGDADTLVATGLSDAGPTFNADVYGLNWRDDAAFIAACDPDTIRRLIADARLGAAWREAEAALPEGWRIAHVSQRLEYAETRRQWVALAKQGRGNFPHRCLGTGPTPAAALLALAAALRERKP